MSAAESEAFERALRPGARVELVERGLARVGTVWYCDQLQLLVKWDDGGSSSLRVGRDDRGLRVQREDPAEFAAVTWRERR